MATRAELRYRDGRIVEPDYLNSVDEVDSLIDELLTGPAHENLAQIIHLDRPLMRPEWPDHELLIGVDRAVNLGVVAFTDSEGSVISAGSPETRAAPVYYLAGHWTELSDQVEIPIDIVRNALKEFLISGGKRPTCVPWKERFPDG
ncbi:Imm1 family immunity protein [Kitasatospora sp. NPDC048298]|uniref:Imm1 family immunity protein n=1 Tax=Kitasatospora sp. NPDC048298 TaxID=3364049 RepID=UPI003723CC23